MDINNFFKSSLEELNEKILSGKEYDILMTSGILRKLLLDGDATLIYQIDKKNNPLRFKVNLRLPLHKSMPNLFIEQMLLGYSWFVEDGLNPDTANKNRNDFNLQELTLDEFLKVIVISIHGHDVTIKDLILHFANKEGGIHKQKKPFSEEEQINMLLRQLSNLVGINNLPAGLNTIRAISIIVYRDLSKYKDKI